MSWREKVTTEGRGRSKVWTQEGRLPQNSTPTLLNPVQFSEATSCPPIQPPLPPQVDDVKLFR